MSNKTTSKKTPPESSSGHPPPPSAASPECESCRSAPGIPFCRVDWSFLCTSCASIVHSHNCVISVSPNPNPNPNPNPSHLPHYPFPYPHPFPNPSFDPSPLVPLTSDDDDPSPARRASSFRRLESVMRYREKRKSRKFEKTVRYENRRAYAELRPRLDGKFARGKGEEEGKEVNVLPEAGDGVEARVEDGGALEGLVVELGQNDFVEDVRFQ